MLIGGIYDQNEILGSAMQAAVTRNTVINNNISNNDTPNYKKYGVSFEESLQQAILEYRRTGELNLSGAVPEISRINTNLSTRIDGNNVDINEENVSLYKNSVLYDALSNSVIANYKLLNAVFNMR